MGSEMCIRDSLRRANQAGADGRLFRQQQGREKNIKRGGTGYLRLGFSDGNTGGTGTGRKGIRRREQCYVRRKCI